MGQGCRQTLLRVETCAHHGIIKTIFIYNLCFGLSKQYSAGPESEIGLSYANVVCVYGGRGGEWGLEVFVGRGQNFFYLLCVYVGGGGGQVHYLSFREKNYRHPLLFINDWSL